jgi:thiol-disulfide isomerase/thioredoxin
MMHAILLAGLLIAQTVSDDRAQTSLQTDSQSAVAPAFSLKNLRGRIARLSDYKGKVVLINLWATWCAPCLVEMPELVKLQKEHEARGLQIIGVTFPNDRRTSVRRMVRRFKLNYPVLFGTPELLDAYQIGEVLPVTVVVDRSGKIRARILGILEPEDFRENVAPLLEPTDVRK